MKTSFKVFMFILYPLAGEHKVVYGGSINPPMYRKPEGYRKDKKWK